ncbi:uncharacterized protein LOC125236172 [Leguminivora glycinivorella]|uniref:uncharacterized protein LOC125236172 n=1 Tax=Leguminivora glycinivorella TaxID=1035111 RepID=UPI00201032B8|nr:uncharacterized protein LOC125236172 [Leguminivora glycinivorella]
MSSDITTCLNKNYHGLAFKLHTLCVHSVCNSVFIETMAVIRCFCSVIAVMIITDSHAGLIDRHVRAIVEDDFNSYDDILDAIHKSKYGFQRNSDELYSDDNDLHRSIDDMYGDDYGVFYYDGDGINRYDPRSESDNLIDNDYFYAGDDDFKNKRGITNNDVGVYDGMYRSRGRRTKGKVDKAKIHDIIDLLHQYNPIMNPIIKLYSMKGRKRRISWRKWIGWSGMDNDSINGNG